MMRDWLQTAVLVLKIIIEYGPGVYKIGREIYDAVERWAEEKRTKGGQQPSSADKAGVYDVALAARAGNLPRQRRERLRELIWQSRNPEKRRRRVKG